MSPSLEIGRLRSAISTVFRGSNEAVEYVIVAFLASGHVLIEDIPGVGKTTLAKALAQSIGGRFRRLQCTPDLMPTDVTGVSIYDERERHFTFHPGPVFCDVLLADELNRTPPRTQAALLEALSEGQVTVEGEARALSPSFFCVATQNPLDHAGTYSLPESQRDRFLLAFRLGYPDAMSELDLLAHDGAEADLANLEPILDETTRIQLRAATRQVELDDSVRRYILEIVRATRESKGLLQGASPRAGLGLQRAAQGEAMLRGRNFVIPEDVQAMGIITLAHRVSPRTGHLAENVIRGILETLAVPR
ncbi:MAG: ATPase associated with various cellular 3 [Chthoniobacteraceae bacterium]|nr:ATPase associated with various cellular 3 [Chthoniobacteraceae bacterium]